MEFSISYTEKILSKNAMFYGQIIYIYAHHNALREESKSKLQSLKLKLNVIINYLVWSNSI